ncbi:MAG TPA: hypothetical protein LFV91_02425 [Rickettsia endosymbiont of Bembidion nr. Transversale]|nr:hypothetical protein [Rickettsia endosymbiont of Bembidion nr. Transversale]
MTDQSINKVNNYGYTALTGATANGLEKVCETLIPKMSQQAINHITNDGYTALTEAVANGLEKVCETLIPKMSNEAINHVANDGYTALTLATQTKLEKIYEMLILRMKLVIFQNLVAEITEKLKTNTAINEKDKNTIQNSINEIIRRVETFTNKDDIDTMTKSMQELVKNKITKARIAVVEEDLNEIIEQQINLNEQIRTEKLTIFGNVIAEMTTKIKNSTTINEKDKDIIQDSIKEIVSKVQMLNNKTDIETITENVKDFISGKITKARIAVIDEDVDQLIEQQSKLSQNVIVNKLTEVIYDKPLLNYPKLLETALSKFSLQKIGELSNELSPHLVQQAIYNNDEELVLAGLTSLANDQTPTAD